MTWRQTKTKLEKVILCHTHYVFYGFETIQETGTHVPNLCVAQLVCEDCIDEPFESSCDFCKEKQVIFKGTNTLNESGDWCMKQRIATFIAHNFKGFDRYFILEYLYKLEYIPKIIKQGGTKKKGYFPHLFNKTKNQNYVGPIPAASFYCPDNMSTPKRHEFLQWYDNEVSKGEPFDFQKEIVNYCVSDVDILRRCCVLLREYFMDVTKKGVSCVSSSSFDSQEDDLFETMGNDIESTTPKERGGGGDPFKHCITIASVCNLVFHRNFLKPDSIAVFTNQQEKNHSCAALQWLHFERLRRGIHIEDARNGGERRIGPYFVDGFAPISKTIFSFHGCFWHGCPDCFDEDTIHPHKITMEGTI
ncbi:hypothetical protein HOLleu_00630 [Holothuria leucospilota]|uniref:DNA-directed DNA polymerase n=1 Tax=Holothuria leucospilota TaxID=206669 RepID=A0A9Q1CN05_HOLLE|nr:hypothetical protein HOLleu_00630 [Holothuria leucospilota]